MHKVFISYHHRNDQYHKNYLLAMNGLYVEFIDRSVHDDDIDEDLPDQTILFDVRTSWTKMDNKLRTASV